MSVVVVAVAVFVAGTPISELAKAYELMDGLNYDAAAPIAHAVAEDPASSHEHKVEALFLEGYCLAVSDKQQAASDVFKALVAFDVDAKPKFEMEFKAKYLFVQAHDEEVAKRKAAADAEKAKLFSTVKLDVGKPDEVTGGQKAAFAVTVTDPNNVVTSMRIEFKKVDDPDFYSLPLVKEDNGSWTGAIPGTFTKTKKLMRLLYVITASSAQRDDVVTRGSLETPEELFVEAGTDVASGLTANERLPWGNRLFYVGVVSPLICTIVFAAGMAVSVAFQAIGAGTLVLAVAPPTLATVTAYFTTAQLIDGWKQALPAGAVGLFSSIYALCVLISQAQLRDPGAGPPVPRTPGPEQDLVFNIGAGSAVVGAVVGTVVGVTLVASDRPSE